MQTLDSTKFIIPIDALNSIDESKFLDNALIDHENDALSVVKVLRRDNKVPGIKNVRVINGETIELEASAKVLSDNYLQGININTIPQLLESCSKVGLHLKTNDAIELGSIVSCDITTGVYMCDKEFSIYKVGMGIAMIHPKIGVIPYTKKGNNGIEFRGEWSTKKVRLINYSKEEEMRPTMANKAFLSTCSNPQMVLDQFKDLRRIEMNLRSCNELKKHVGIEYKGKPKILDVLCSNKKVAYNLLNKYMHLDLKILNTIDKYKDMSIKEQAKMMGMIAICERFNFDERIIIDYLKLKEGRNWVQHWHGRGRAPGFRHILQNRMSKQNDSGAQLGEMAMILNGFMNKLKQAI
jgi:hypothetical protein